MRSSAPPRSSAALASLPPGVLGTAALPLKPARRWSTFQLVGFSCIVVGALTFNKARLGAACLPACLRAGVLTRRLRPQVIILPGVEYPEAAPEVLEPRAPVAMNPCSRGRAHRAARRWSGARSSAAMCVWRGARAHVRPLADARLVPQDHRE